VGGGINGKKEAEKHTLQIKKTKKKNRKVTLLLFHAIIRNSQWQVHLTEKFSRGTGG